MKKRVTELEENIQELKRLHHEAQERWSNADVNAALKGNIYKLFKEMIDQHKNSIIRANQRKLVKLNGENIKHPHPIKCYINLTKKTLTADQEELLDMGLNCHIMSKPRKFRKRLECEILLEQGFPTFLHSRPLC